MRKVQTPSMRTVHLLLVTSEFGMWFFDFHFAIEKNERTWSDSILLLKDVGVSHTDQILEGGYNQKNDWNSTDVFFSSPASFLTLYFLPITSHIASSGTYLTNPPNIINYNVNSMIFNHLGRNTSPIEVNARTPIGPANNPRPVVLMSLNFLYTCDTL